MGFCLTRLGVLDPRYPFCGLPKTLMHLFWFCRRAQQLWAWIHDFFRPFRLEPFSWHMVLMGDSTWLPFKFTQIWHAFRMEILFSLWQGKIVILFSHSSLDLHVSLYDKACICNNVMLQIQVQVNKVALKVAHLQVLLDHCGNSPCMVVRILQDPFSFDDCSPVHGHRCGHIYSIGSSRMSCS